MGVERLFSYGTLREEPVQRAVFGHAVEGVSDAILGYRLCAITLADARTIALSGTADHTILEPTGRSDDQVEGIVLELNAADLARADAYEDAAYKRVRAAMRSGAEAWVYVRG